MGLSLAPTSQRLGTALTVLRLWGGRLLNALGTPGVVQPGTYDAGIGAVSVRITLGPLFTVINVNGVDVYLDRFTGEIDGVGFGAASELGGGLRPPSEPPPQTGCAGEA
ncbi:MAG: hypothetical protein C5B48_08050, partial [Candidatus Rokuibacteriota bacterium]